MYVMAPPYSEHHTIGIHIVLTGRDSQCENTIDGGAILGDTCIQLSRPFSATGNTLMHV